MGKHQKVVHPPQENIEIKQLWNHLKTDLKDAMELFSPAFLVPVIISIILLCIFVLRLYIRWNVPCKSQKRLEGKTVIITGLGRATASELAKRGAKIILACRNQKRGEAVARIIRNKTGNEDINAYYLDLASLRSIKEFVYEFNSREPYLHVLINNAGYLGPKATTEDGYERTFGVNYLGHFYLSYLLKEKMKKCAPCRIVNVASSAYTIGKIDFEDLALTNYNIYKAYARSKLAQIQFTIEAHRRWSPDVVLSYAVHPGAVSTDLLRNWPGLKGKVLRMARNFLFKSPEDGCQTIVHCAVGEGLRDVSGNLFTNCAIVQTKKNIREKQVCRKLWDLSLHLCGLDDEIEKFSSESEDMEQNHNKPNPEQESKKSK
ncbi:hypothetical protein KUTeg_010435 [Tegillarca granosa]|uniref:Uncharacterized protein n=1 Tax=Tegillarca granosa TaxID=220873 RepID=A0ABQ9FB36_TEGGR|nr:hypothetical protein KUTeg_010435 [Tegillarca granosa]